MPEPQHPISTLLFNHKTWLILSLFWIGCIAVLSLMASPPTIESLQVKDKILHFGAYALLALLLGLTFYCWPSRWSRPWLLSGVISITFGGIVELLQQLMHQGRTAEWGDFATNMAGVLLVCVVFR
ncbi:MAG: VanZ family protein, partial [Desulfuromonadales bacterium]|nr:VanZ family protein [Desulfuromonadales bacterium]